MNSDNTDTGKKLQELENLSLPDLSKMDEHWQKMRTVLQPASMASPSKSVPAKRLFRWMMAAILIGGMSLVAYKYLYSYESDSRHASGKINQPVVNVISKDTPVHKFHHNLRSKDSPVLRFNRQVISKDPPVRKFNQVKKTGTGDTILPKAIMNSIVPGDPSKASLEIFFKQLEKGAQEFVINNRRDTIINGKEGSSLLIPAYTFGDQDKVVIAMKEFYSYADIITNKLNTTSGNEQLETGGMIHIAASVDGKEVNMSPGKTIRWFLEDTTSNMEGMQLFTGDASVRSQSQRIYDNKDTVVFSTSNGFNWQQQNQRFQNNFISTSVKVLDLRDLPYKVTTTRGKYKAFFAINKESVLSKDELIAALHKKYHYYDKIVIGKGPKNKTWQTFISSEQIITLYSLGDSTWLPLPEANMYKLPSRDTLISSNTTSIQNTSIPIKEIRKLASRYSVDIFSLGWINCDRFYNDNRSKIDYVVNLNDSAANYYTILIFDRIKSMMTGYASGNKVVFSNVPNGEPVKIVSIGIQDGKTVSAMASAQLSKSTFTALKFEETTPIAFKENVKVFDK